MQKMVDYAAAQPVFRTAKKESRALPSAKNKIRRGASPSPPNWTLANFTLDADSRRFSQIIFDNIKNLRAKPAKICVRF